MDHTQPPASPEIEQALLGAILIDPSVMPVVDGIIGPDDFYAERNGWIYAAMQHLADTGTLDYLMLCKKLDERAQLADIGGDAYLTDLIAGNPSVSSASWYASAVADLATKRRLATGAAQMTMIAHDAANDAAAVLAQAQAILDGAGRKAAGSPFVSFGDVIGEVISEAQSPNGGLKTGFTLFDHMTGGLRPGEMILIAARPSHGKTTLVLQMAFNAARNGVPVAIFSLEMRRQQLIQRLLAAIASVPAEHLRDGRLTTDEWTRVMHWSPKVAEYPIWIDDTPDLTVAEIRARIMSLKTRPGLVVIDYIQLMRGGERAENRVQEIASVSRGVKGLAKTMGVPVLACCQLNRASEGRSDSMPDLADLRESGQLEQDADVVAFVHRPRMKDPTNPNENATIRVAKDRMGARGDFQLHFHEQFVRFVNLTKDGGS
jgi:replicative DNA helicase